MVRKDILKDKIMSNAILETETTFHNETQIYGAPKDFNLPAIPEKIIDVEYTEIDSHKQIISFISFSNGSNLLKSMLLFCGRTTFVAKILFPNSVAEHFWFVGLNVFPSKVLILLSK